MEQSTVEPDNKQKVENTATPKEAVVPVVEEKETQEQINWKKFREAREVERKQKEAAEKKAAEKEAEATALKAAMDALLSKTPANHHPQQPDEQEISEDDRINRKVQEALEERDRRYQEEKRKIEQQEYPHRLIANFTDFNQICNTENLDYLEFHYPEVAQAFSQMPEGYNKWAAVYKAVKRFVPNPDSKKDSAKADKNFAKPQAISIAGKTQVGDSAPQKLDDKRRMDNWNRMQKVMKGGIIG